MTDDDFNALVVGDIIRAKGGARAYIVTGHFGSHVIAVRTAEITNPEEWDVIFKSNPQRVDQES